MIKKRAVRTVLDIADFRQQVAAGRKPIAAVLRLAVTAEASVVAGERAMSFVFSDESVDRYGDIIFARGWLLENFAANPVALFGHDASKPENVIGRARNVRVEGTRLLGDIVFAEAAVNPVAETVFRMLQGGFLKCVSVGFQPIEWAAAKDKSRPGGIDFRKQELLEISVVPIPANPNALVEAKAAGIDVERLGLVAGKMPALQGSLDRGHPARSSFAVTTKGLYQVSYLASLLSDLGYLQEWVQYEADYEGDGSEIPQRMADAMKALGQILIDMTAEEVAELLAEIAGGGEEEVLDEGTELAANSPAQKAFVALARLARSARAAEGVRYLTLLEAKVLPLAARAGKVLSEANEKCLRDAHAKITEACDTIMGVVASNQKPDDADDAENGDPGDEDDAEEKQAERTRKASALSRRARLALVE